MGTAARKGGGGLCLESELPLGSLCPQPGSSVCLQEMHSQGSPYQDCALQGSGCGTPIDTAACSSSSLEESGPSTFVHPDQDRSALLLLGMGHEDDPELLFDSPYSAAEFVDPQVGSLKDLLDLEDTECSTLPAGTLLPPPAFTIIAQEQRLEAAWLLARPQQGNRLVQVQQQQQQQQQVVLQLPQWVPAMQGSYRGGAAATAPVAIRRRADAAAAASMRLIPPGRTHLSAAAGPAAGAAVPGGCRPPLTQQQQQQQQQQRPAVLIPVVASPAAAAAAGLQPRPRPTAGRRVVPARGDQHAPCTQAAAAAASGGALALALSAPAPGSSAEAAEAAAAALSPTRPGLDLSAPGTGADAAAAMQGHQRLARGRAKKRSWAKYRVGGADSSWAQPHRQCQQQQQQEAVAVAAADPQACLLAPVAPSTSCAAAAAAAAAVAADQRDLAAPALVQEQDAAAAAGGRPPPAPGRVAPTPAPAPGTRLLHTGAAAPPGPPAPAAGAAADRVPGLFHPSTAAAVVAASRGELRVPHVPPGSTLPPRLIASTPASVVWLELEGRKVEVLLTPDMDAAAFEQRVREALGLQPDEELDMTFEVPRPGGPLKMEGLETFDAAARLAAQNAAMRTTQQPLQQQLQRRPPRQQPQRRKPPPPQKQKQKQKQKRAAPPEPPRLQHVPPESAQVCLLPPCAPSDAKQPPRKSSRLAAASSPSPLPPRPAFPPSLPLFVNPQLQAVLAVSPRPV